MSRLGQARPAVRPALKSRMMLSGPAGAGKTRSALIIATVLAEGGTILGIDTEKESMLTYADDFDFVHLGWAAPYNPRELVEVLNEASDQYAAIIIDSLSHFWRKEGGTLDIANGKFTGWKEARPAQEDLVDAILDSHAHVVLGVRSKVEHTQETENGKVVVRKIGMAAQQDDDLEFEMNIAVELAMDHTATISKSRTTALLVGRSFKAGHASDMAEIYRDWLKGGEPPAPASVVKEILDRINALDEQDRKACKQEFVATIGRPEYLRESQVNAAWDLVAKHTPDGQPFESEASGPDGREGEEESAGNGDDTPPAQLPGEAAAAPEQTAAAADPEPPAKPAKARTPKTPAQMLHIEAGNVPGIGEDGLDLIILNETGGRTSSANDLTEQEITAVRFGIQDVAEGKTSLAKLRAAVEAKVAS